MSSALIRACPLCGLPFATRPLLDLHIREDHPKRNRHAEPDHDHSGDSQAEPVAEELDLRVWPFRLPAGWRRVTKLEGPAVSAQEAS